MKLKSQFACTIAIASFFSIGCSGNAELADENEVVSSVVQPMGKKSGKKSAGKGELAPEADAVASEAVMVTDIVMPLDQERVRAFATNLFRAMPEVLNSSADGSQELELDDSVFAILRRLRLTWDEWTIAFGEAEPNPSDESLAAEIDHQFLSVEIAPTPASFLAFLDCYAPPAFRATGPRIVNYLEGRRIGPTPKERLLLRAEYLNFISTAELAFKQLFRDLQSLVSDGRDQVVNVDLSAALSLLQADRQFQVFYPVFQEVAARIQADAIRPGELTHLSGNLTYRVLQNFLGTDGAKMTGVVFFDHDRHGRIVPVGGNWRELPQENVQCIGSVYGDYASGFARHVYVMTRDAKGVWTAATEPGIFLRYSDRVEMGLVSGAIDPSRMLDRNFALQSNEVNSEVLTRSTRTLIAELLKGEHAAIGWLDDVSGGVFLRAESWSELMKSAKRVMSLAARHWDCDDADAKYFLFSALNMLGELGASLDAARLDDEWEADVRDTQPSKVGKKAERRRRAAEPTAAQSTAACATESAAAVCTQETDDVSAAKSISVAAACAVPASLELVATAEASGSARAKSVPAAPIKPEKATACAAAAPAEDGEDDAPSRDERVAELVEKLTEVLPEGGQMPPWKIRQALGRMIKAWFETATETEIEAVTVKWHGSHAVVSRKGGDKATHVERHSRKAREGVPVGAVLEEGRQIARALVPEAAGAPKVSDADPKSAERRSKKNR